MTTLTHKIYGPDTWSLTAFRSDPRTPHLLEWLKANGIDTAALPVEQAIAVDATEQGKVIRYVSYLSDPDGRLITAGDSQVFEARTAPLLVDPPDELRPDTWPKPEPTEDTTTAPAPPVVPVTASTDPAAVNGQTPGLLDPANCGPHTIADASRYGDGNGHEYGVCSKCGTHCTRETGGEWRPVTEPAGT